MPAPPTRLLLATVLAVAMAVLASDKADASTRIAGNVWKIDQEGSRVTIIDAGRRLTFSYDVDTIIRRGSTNRTINDLRRGDRVVVTLAEETPDVLRARLIAIAGPPAASGSGLNIFR